MRILLVFLLFPVLVPAGEVLTLRWNELQGAVANKQAIVTLTDNREVKGIISAVTDDAIVMERAATGRIGRGSVREIRVRQVKGPRRAIGSAAAGAGAAFGLLPWAISDSRVNVSDGARIASWAGITAGATIAGYVIGRHFDTKETVIRISSTK